ncbi:terminase family protein [Bradyrhizobium sp. UFLA05-153]
MADRFLREIWDMHELRKDVRSLPRARAEEFTKRLGDDAADDWVFRARDAQLPPSDLEWCWLFLGGRGTGKSHSMSAAVHMAVRAGISRIHLIAPTTADFHDVNLEGRSGILATCGRDPRPRWTSSKRRLEWPNGAMCVFFSGEEPDSLRGPQCEMCVIDEIARMRYQQAVFDMAMMGLRLGDKPRMLIATTPRTTPFMKKLVAMDGIRITSGSTYDNAAHLAPDFLRKIREIYEGTRLGRQELHGAMILDPVNALFKDDWLIHDEVPEESIEQATVGVDPSGGADEVGIVVSALLNDGRFAVLADRSTSGSPAQWGEAAVKAHDDFDGDDIVVEINFGGDMATEVIKQAAERIHARGERGTNMIRIKEVSASRGKAMRAEPISLLYEKGRVLHRRGLDQLESEMMAFSREWDRAVDGSPNRLDAMVWGLTRLSKVITQIPIA